jgi:hypothetical protein
MLSKALCRNKNALCSLFTSLLLIVSLPSYAQGQTGNQELSLSAEAKARVLEIFDTFIEANATYRRELMDKYPLGQLPRDGDQDVKFPISVDDENFLISMGQSLLAQTNKDWELLYKIVTALSRVPSNDRVVQFMSQTLHREVKGSPGLYERSTYTGAVGALAEQGTDEALQIVYAVAILPVRQTPGLLNYSGSSDDAMEFRLHIAKNAWTSILNVVQKNRVRPLMQKVADQYPPDDSEYRKEIEIQLWVAERIAADLPWRAIPYRESQSLTPKSFGNEIEQ